MIILINRNEDQPMPLGEFHSYYEYFETNNLPKGEKGKIRDTHSHGLSAYHLKIMQKIIVMEQQLAKKDPPQTMMVLLTPQQKFRIVRIGPRPCLTLR